MSSSETAPAISPHRSSNLTAKRVLVVEDDHDGAEMLAELLGSLGCDARFVLDGTSALTLTKVFTPQVIFLDVDLPDMSGHDVARQVRQAPGLSDVVLVAVTGWVGTESEQRAREAGFDHFMLKPISLPALCRVLEV